MRCEFEMDCYRAKYCGMPTDCEQRTTVLTARAIDEARKDEAEALRAQGLKRCKRCNQVKKLVEYWHHAKNLDGREGTCIECRKMMMRKRARVRGAKR